MEDLVGKFVNSAKTTTTTTGAAAKKGTNLVKRINPRPQQTEVASTEASQGMASIILGSVGYQQAQSKKSAGEVADTSEAIEPENSPDQEVINETAEVMNNDIIPPPPPLPPVDITLPPLPPVDDVPPPPPLPPVDITLPPLPPVDAVDVPPPPPPPPVEDAFVTEYENIIRETNPDTKKSRLEQFFTPNDDSDLTLRQVGWIFDLLDNFKNDSTQNNSTQNTITIALEAFLKNPSNDKDVFKVQYDLAEQALKNQTLNKNDEILKNLFSPSEDDITRETQYSVLKNELDSLKLFAGVLDINKNSLKVALDVFLQTPSENNNTFEAQCDLAKTAFENQIIDADDTILKNLFSPSDNACIRCNQHGFIYIMLNNIYKADSDDSQKAFAKAALLNFLAKDDNMNDDLLPNQCYLAETAVTKGILKAEDKDIITKFLQTPSVGYNTFETQCDLAKTLIKNGILEPDVSKDKYIITKFLQTPSEDNHTFEVQCDLAKTLIKNGILEPDVSKDKYIITKFLQTPSEYYNTFVAQYDLAEEIFKTQTIDAEDAILKNLFSLSDNEDIRYIQFYTMNNMLNKKINADSDDSKKTFAKIALNTILTPSDNYDTFKAQCDLAETAFENQIIDADDEIFQKLFSPIKPGRDLSFRAFMIKKHQYKVINNMLTNLQEPITNTHKNFLKCALKAFLKNPSKDSNTLEIQCNLAADAVEKGILNTEEPTDKEIITKFLENPSNNIQVLGYQCYLAEAIKADDEIFQKLFSPSEDYFIRKTQYKVINTMLNDLQEPITDTHKNFLKRALKIFFQTPIKNDDNFLKLSILARTLIIKNGFMEPEELKKVLDKVKNLILDQKIAVAKNLSSLTNDQLKSINEAKLLQDSENENKQFKLEYFIDLKISRGLYNDNWEDLENVIKNNAKILTPEDDSNILTPKDNRNIYDDGVYNLTVIALKQMPLDKRNGFLSSIYKYTLNSNLKELLTNDNKCNNEMLLRIRPVLKQYKNKYVGLAFINLSHDYRIPRTTDKCEVFEESGQRYLGYQGTNQRIKTDLSQEQIEYLFGEQRPNSNQHEVGNCWLISELKEFNYDPKLKLFIMSRFSMDKNGDVSITLKNNNKVTFPKDIVEKATTTVNDEHLSPAMACLSLLAALNRTRENDITDIDKDGIFNQNITANEDYLKQQFKKENTMALRRTSHKSLKPLTDSQDPIYYALRKYNETGWLHNDLLSLFFDEAQNPDSNKENFIIKSTLYTYRHGWSHYDDELAANPQKSNTLFKKENVLPNDPSDDSRKDLFYIGTHYYVPKIDINKQEFYS